MALFRHHTNDSQSPFDVDDAPAYVALNADIVPDEEEPTPPASRRRTGVSPRTGRPLRLASIPQPAPRTLAPNTAKASTRQARPVTKSRTTDDDDPRPISGAAVAALLLMIVSFFIPGTIPAIVAAALGATIGLVTAIRIEPALRRGRAMALIAVVCSILILFDHVPMLMLEYRIRTMDVNAVISRSATDDDRSQNEEPQPSVFEDSGTLTDEDESLELAITRAFAGPHDEDGERTVFVCVDARNTGSVTTSLSQLATADVYQNGVALPHPIFDGNQAESWGYEGNAHGMEILPDGTATLTFAFVLRDETTPVDVRLTAHDDMTIIKSGFTIGADTAGTDLTRMPVADLPEPERTTQAELSQMHTVESYDGKPRAAVRVTGLRRGPDRYDGAHTVIASFDWSNQSQVPISLTDCCEMKVFRNGVEIQRTALVDPVEGYEQSSDQIDVLPGSGMTVTVAYEVPSWDGAYTVQLTQINDASVVHDEMAVTDPQ